MALAIRMPSPVSLSTPVVPTSLPRFGHFSLWQYSTRISTLPAKPPVASTTPFFAVKVYTLFSASSPFTPTHTPLSTISSLALTP